MNQKSKITLHRGENVIYYVAPYREKELACSSRVRRKKREFVRTDRNPGSFANFHLDQLAAAGKHELEGCGAESEMEEVTGARKFQLMPTGHGFAANYRIVYHSGNEIPVVISSAP